MTRFTPRSRDELDPDQAALHDRLTSGPRAGAAAVVPLTDAAGRLIGPFGPMTIQPVIGDAVQAVGAALRFSSSLSARTREAAILLVAAARECAQEWTLHQPAATAAGLDEDDLDDLRHGRVPASSPPQEREVLSVVAFLLRDGDLDDDAYARANAELGERVFAEAVWLVGYYSMLALALRVWRAPV